MATYQRKPNQRTGSRFITVFAAYTVPGEWVTAREFAGRVWTRGGSAWVKEISRKLSNLERQGLAARRVRGECFEYTRVPVVDTSQGEMPP